MNMVVLLTRLRHYLAQPDIRRILLVIIISRVVLTGIGVMVRNDVFSFTHDRELPQPVTQHQWLNVWGTWDAGWYLRIAQEGYSTSEIQRFAFFPFYPSLVRSVSSLTGHTFFVGWLISNLALTAAALLLYELTGREYRHRTWSVWFLLAFPSAFVLSGMFTESLFLAFAVGAWLAAHKQRWWLAGTLAALATLTRSIGVLVGMALVIEFFRQRRTGFGWRHLAWLGLVPVALGGWLWYNQVATGDPLTFIHVQSHWRRAVTNPVMALWSGVTASNGYDQALAWFWIGLMVIAFSLRRKIDPALTVYLWLALLVPLFGGIYSLPRYALAFFPLFIGLARIQWRPWIRWTILSASAIVQLTLFLYWPLPNSWIV